MAPRTDRCGDGGRGGDHVLARQPFEHGRTEVKSALLDTPLTLGRLHRLYTNLGGTLPSDFDKLVVKPRNDAAHRGMSLTSEQSAAAIDATEALLKATTPLVL
jgi:hypothetical protein